MSTQTEFQAADMRPPSGDFFPTKEFRLAGTGATEAATTAALKATEMATLLNGATAIRFRLKGSAPGVGSVATTDPILGPYARLDWMVQAETDDFVAIEAADGSSAYEAWVWTSSGERQYSTIGVCQGHVHFYFNVLGTPSQATVEEIDGSVAATFTTAGDLTDAA